MADKAISNELQPNFTGIPNVILDTIHTRTVEENILLFVICRKTYGWHKDHDRMSLSQLQKLTGLSRPTVIKCREGLKDKGWIKVLQDKKKNMYYGVLDARQSTEFTSKPDLPELVNHVYQSSKPDLPEVVNGVYTQNKLSKKTNKTNYLNKGRTETHSESSNPDKQTKIQPTKEQGTPLKAKISHSESNQSTNPSQYMGNDSEKPVRSISPKERFLEIHREIAKEIELGRRIMEDISALPEIVEILEGNTEKFTQLCRFYLADEFYRDKGFSQKSLLSCLNNRNVFAVVTDKINHEEIHELRRTVRVIDGSQYAGMEAPF